MIATLPTYHFNDGVIESPGCTECPVFVWDKTKEGLKAKIARHNESHLALRELLGK